MSSSLEKTKSDILKLSLTLFAIAAIMALLVSLVNNITSPIIAQQNINKTTAALQKIMKDADEFEEIIYPEQSMRASDNRDVNIDKVWKAKSKGETVGYCVKVSPYGYGGAIETIVAVNLTGEVVEAEILSMSETSGIGTKIQENSFLSQFNGKKLSNLSGVQLISGATRSSSGYYRGIEIALMVALAVNGGEWDE